MIKKFTTAKETCQSHKWTEPWAAAVGNSPFFSEPSVVALLPFSMDVTVATTVAAVPWPPGGGDPELEIRRIDFREKSDTGVQHFWTT